MARYQLSEVINSFGGDHTHTSESYVESALSINCVSISCRAIINHGLPCLDNKLQHTTHNIELKEEDDDDMIDIVTGNVDKAGLTRGNKTNSIALCASINVQSTF